MLFLETLIFGSRGNGVVKNVGPGGIDPRLVREICRGVTSGAGSAVASSQH